MTALLDWKCSGCGKPSPDRLRTCDCPTNCLSGSKGSALKIDPAPHFLAETIRTRILGVPPEEQDVVLEDHDWRLILNALERHA